MSIRYWTKYVTNLTSNVEFKAATKHCHLILGLFGHLNQAKAAPSKSKVPKKYYPHCDSQVALLGMEFTISQQPLGWPRSHFDCLGDRRELH